MTDSVIYFDGRIEARQTALSLIQQAKQRICFFGNTLDKVLFGDADCVSAIQAMALSSSRAQAQFVLRDCKKASMEGHPLIPLVQKLTSRIALHQAHHDHCQLKHYMLLIDQRAFLYGSQQQTYEGRSSLNAPAETRQFQQQFDIVWDQSIPDPFTRRLSL